jgi:hypothetical protein
MGEEPSVPARGTGNSKTKTGEHLAHAAPTGCPGLTATKGDAQTGIRTSARSESGRERMQPAAEGRGPKARDSNRMKQLEPGIAETQARRSGAHEKKIGHREKTEATQQKRGTEKWTN